METPSCKTPQEHYIVKYQTALDFAEEQFSVGWSEKEIPVEDDIQEFLVEASEADRQALIIILKLFTKYELEIGGNYWLGRIYERFPRTDIRRMAVAFANTELNWHAPFYAKLNTELNLDDEEFYESYRQSPHLVERMQFIADGVNADDDLLSLAMFSMIEGAILYSAFAFLKHYRVGGKNLFKNLISGIDFSVRDENLHALGGAWLFRTLLAESKPSDQYKMQLFDDINAAAHTIVLHESEIINEIFSQGDIPGITAEELLNYVRSRVDECLSNLGAETAFNIEKEQNPIAEWFYDNINAIKFHDFFDTTGNEYNRNWNESRFEWGVVA